MPTSYRGTLLALGVLVLLAAPAQALAFGSPTHPHTHTPTHSLHPRLVRSEPPANSTLDRPPAQVSVWFDEGIEPDYAHLSVYGADQQRVDNYDARYLPGDQPGIAASLPELPRGSYVVVWRVVSTADGHAVGGAFAFGVGVAPDREVAAAAQAAASTQPDLTTFLIRFLNLAAQLGLVGAAAVHSLGWRPANARAAAAGVLPPAEMDALEREQRRWLTPLADVLVAALAIGVPGALYVQARAAGVVFWDLFGTRWGAFWLARAALAVAAALTMERVVSGRARPWWLGWALGLGLLITTALTSHASATGSVLAPAVDLAHQLAAGIWAGGLARLALALAALGRAPLKVADGSRGRMAALWVGRFSGVALLSVALVAASGLVLALGQVQSWAALRTTPYGLVLIVKILLVVVALAFGAYNTTGGLRHASQARPLRAAAWMLAESIVLAAVVFGAAMLADLPPAIDIGGLV
jgi:copper transport protein